MRLKELRKYKGLYQKDIAQFLGLERTTYVKYESGVSEPTIDTLIRLCRYYGVTMDYLLELTDDPGTSSVTHDSQGLLNGDEQDLIDKYRALTKQGKEYIRQTMQMAFQTYAGEAGISFMEDQEVG